MPSVWASSLEFQWEDLASKIALLFHVLGRTLRECYGNKDEVPGSVHGETRIFKCTTRKLGDFSQLAVDGHQIGDF